MKKTLSILALGAFVAGCAPSDYTVATKSPWAIEGNTGSSGNPIAKVATPSTPEEIPFVGVDAPGGVASGPVVEGPRLQRNLYSWDQEKIKAEAAAKAAAEEAAKAIAAGAEAPASASAVASLSPDKIRITGVRNDLGLFSFLRIEKPAPQQILTVHDGKVGARIRVVHVEGETIIAEVLPNQEYVPPIIVGGEILCTDDIAAREKAEIAAAAAAAAAASAAPPPPTELVPLDAP
jgi:hypothetical protein